jgi:hypothetical protein
LSKETFETSVKIELGEATISFFRRSTVESDEKNGGTNRFLSWIRPAGFILWLLLQLANLWFKS